MTAFVDTSVWFAAIVTRDKSNSRAKAILRSNTDLATTDHVLIETWQLLNARYRRDAAEQFWEALRMGAAHIELVSAQDLELAWNIGLEFPDQEFSVVDRTSFAVMQRLGLTQAASFDNDFAVYRYGRRRDKAFEVLR